MRRRFRPMFRPYFRPWAPFRWRRPLGWGWLGLPLFGALGCLAVMALSMMFR